MEKNGKKGGGVLHFMINNFCDILNQNTKKVLDTIYSPRARYTHTRVEHVRQLVYFQSMNSKIWTYFLSSNTVGSIWSTKCPPPPLHFSYTHFCLSLTHTHTYNNYRCWNEAQKEKRVACARARVCVCVTRCWDGQGIHLGKGSNWSGTGVVDLD